MAEVVNAKPTANKANKAMRAKFIARMNVTPS